MNDQSDRRARFTDLAAQVQDPLRHYLLRRAGADEAADLLSDVLLVVWRRLDDVPDPALPWCYGVARRCLANRRRSTDRHLRLVRRLEHSAVTSTPDHADSLFADDPALGAAMEHLTGAEHEIVHLWAWEQLEPAEIAVVVGRSANAVSVALTRARRKLRDELDRQDPSGGGHRGEERIGAREEEQP